ncbi:hypothetical protein N2152v2_010151 [Parachlorella kessleri]
MALALRLLGVAGIAAGLHYWRRAWNASQRPSAEAEPLLQEQPGADKGTLDQQVSAGDAAVAVAALAAVAGASPASKPAVHPSSSGQAAPATPERQHPPDGGAGLPSPMAADAGVAQPPTQPGPELLLPAELQQETPGQVEQVVQPAEQGPPPSTRPTNPSATPTGAAVKSAGTEAALPAGAGQPPQVAREPAAAAGEMQADQQAPTAAAAAPQELRQAAVAGGGGDHQGPAASTGSGIGQQAPVPGHPVAAGPAEVAQPGGLQPRGALGAPAARPEHQPAGPAVGSPAAGKELPGAASRHHQGDAAAAAAAEEEEEEEPLLAPPPAPHLGLSQEQAQEAAPPAQEQQQQEQQQQQQDSSELPALEAKVREPLPQGGVLAASSEGKSLAPAKEAPGAAPGNQVPTAGAAVGRPAMHAAALPTPPLTGGAADGAGAPIAPLELPSPASASEAAPEEEEEEVEISLRAPLQPQLQTPAAEQSQDSDVSLADGLAGEVSGASVEAPLQPPSLGSPPAAVEEDDVRRTRGGGEGGLGVAPPAAPAAAAAAQAPAPVGIAASGPFGSVGSGGIPVPAGDSGALGSLSSGGDSLQFALLGSEGSTASTGGLLAMGSAVATQAAEAVPPEDALVAGVPGAEGAEEPLDLHSDASGLTLPSNWPEELMLAAQEAAVPFGWAAGGGTVGSREPSGEPAGVAMPVGAALMGLAAMPAGSSMPGAERGPVGEQEPAAAAPASAPEASTDAGGVQEPSSPPGSLPGATPKGGVAALEEAVEEPSLSPALGLPAVDYPAPVDPVRLSLSDWVPPGTPGPRGRVAHPVPALQPQHTQQAQQQEQALRQLEAAADVPLPLGSPLPSAGIGSPPPIPPLPPPSWGIPPGPSSPGFRRLSAAAALEGAVAKPPSPVARGVPPPKLQLPAGQPQQPQRPADEGPQQHQGAVEEEEQVDLALPLSHYLKAIPEDSPASPAAATASPPPSTSAASPAAAAAAAQDEASPARRRPSLSLQPPSGTRKSLLNEGLNLSPAAPSSSSAASSQPGSPFTQHPFAWDHRPASPSPKSAWGQPVSPAGSTTSEPAHTGFNPFHISFLQRDGRAPHSPASPFNASKEASPFTATREGGSQGGGSTPGSARHSRHQQQQQYQQQIAAAFSGSGSGGLGAGPPFGTFAAERPVSPISPASDAASASASPAAPRASDSAAARSGASSAGSGRNPFAWGAGQRQRHQQQQQASHSWGEFGVNVGGGVGQHPQPQQQQPQNQSAPAGHQQQLAHSWDSQSAWSAAEERLYTHRPGEKRLRVGELGVQWSMPALQDYHVPRLALQLTVIAGPCAEAGTTYVTKDDTTEVVLGRNPGCTMQLNDAEVSSRHLMIHWNTSDKCWQVADLGSLNGTLLNGEPISQARKRGRDYRLSSDDILQLGTYTKVKVSTFPREMLDPSDRHGSLPIGSLPKSLSVPKHRIPSFTSLLSPKINNTPSKKSTVAAASDELRLECCIGSRAGRDHMRKGQVSEDVASAACPLPGAESLSGQAFPSLFCVLDGHCGRGAAEEANTILPDVVAAQLQGHVQELQGGQGVAAQLRQAFLTTDDRIKAEAGCTATAVLAWRDAEGAVCLQAANVGDSAALLISPETGASVSLTEDHRLSNPKERERLQNLGIQVTNDTRRLYGLNVARGLGDKFLKDEDLGLSAEPYVSPVLRVPAGEGAMLLIATDGLWDFADAETVAQLALASDRDHDGNVMEVTAAVIAYALKQRTRDDVTVLVARIWPESEWDLRSPLKNLDDGAAVSFVSS